MRPSRSNPVVRATVVLGLTLLFLTLSAILMPPKGSNAMPRDGGGQTLTASPTPAA